MTTKTNNRFDPSAHVYEDRTTAWSCVGRDVSECSSAIEVLNTSGLNYQVEKIPLLLADGTPIDGRYMTGRRLDDGTWRTYDIVSDQYQIVQNSDAFAFVDYMGDVRFEKAGETESGMSYIIAALPEVDILGDVFVPHVIFRNGFGGNVTIQAAICQLRMICQNQFAMAFKGAGNTVRVRHVANAEAKLLEAREILRASAESTGLLQARAEELACTHISASQMTAVIDALFPMGGEADEVNAYRRFKVEYARAAFQHAYSAPDNANFTNTAWGIVNAYSDYMTHLIPEGKKDSRFENRMMATTFKPHTEKVMGILEELAIVA